MGEGGLDRGWWVVGSFHHPVYRLHSQTKAESFLYKGSRGAEGGTPTLFSILGVPKKFSRGNISMFDNYFFQLNDCLI